MYQEKISAYFDNPKVKEQLVAAVSRLVAIKSVRGEAQPGKPFGPGPAAALEEALALAGELGLTAANQQGYVGTADLNEKETRLHILGHLDVVGEGTGWSTDPYACVERDGMLYGRGVSDDKGPVVCALLAMKAVRDLNLPLSANARLIMGTDEETGSHDIAWYYARNPYAPYAFTPDADFPVINIEKGHYHPDFGRQWEEETALPRVTGLTGGFRQNVVPPQAQCTLAGLDHSCVEEAAAQVAQRTSTPFTITQEGDTLLVHCAGKNAHAAAPDGGLNAISALLELLALLPLADCESTRALRAMHTLFPFGDNRGAALGIAQEDPECGPLTLNLALMSVTATGFTAKFDVRFPLRSNEDNCKKACEASFAKYGISVTGDPDMTHVHCVPGDSPLVTTLLRCYEAYTGVTNAKPLAIGGGTYVHDIPGGVAFGCEFPGFDPKMHAPDEQVCIDHLLLSCKIFTQAIWELCR
ncbi:M20 family peptidase [Pseudoflavonifractor sp. 524-17]|uniref:Sapep family Mn(2+)-dependent dipeptidase n=1 Tax=Pseudoflavonifractor sp. 524-17 TaxID=2304577 RepID=UPI00137A4BC6|nr:Sapep family Mn(2+)-dependent dipeptidase [Pseudoflavonifractor sp. 524-17]NCE65500.1 M20 family peptidase [Pseudoflavonifractor sp. 524-17]